MSEAALIQVRPREGLRVRYEDPARGHVPPEGADVVLTTYYRRRIADGDLVLVDAPPPPPPKPKRGSA